MKIILVDNAGNKKEIGNTQDGYCVPRKGEQIFLNYAGGSKVIEVLYVYESKCIYVVVDGVIMENYDYASACKPSEHMVHGVETKNSQLITNNYYVRVGPSSKDKVFTDVGIFSIATEGLPIIPASGANVYVPIGELWVIS